MKDEAWGQIGWWIGTLIKWVGLAVVTLLALWVLAFLLGIHA